MTGDKSDHASHAGCAEEAGGLLVGTHWDLLAKRSRDCGLVVGGHDWFFRLGQRRVGEVNSWRRLRVDRVAIPRERDQVFRQTWYLYTYLE